MSRYKTLLAIGALFAISLSAVSASAAPVTSIFFGGPQQWSDNSADVLVNFAGGATTVDVGDVLLTIFTVSTAEQSGVTRNFGVGGVNEFTGFLAIEVASKVGPLGFPGVPDTFYTFSPVSAANRAAIAGMAAYSTNIGPALLGMAATSMVAFFDDPSLDYTRTGAGTVDALSATALNGTKLFEFGFNGAPGEGWSAATVGDDIAVIGATPAPGNGGIVNFAVNLTPGTNVTDVTFLLTPSTFGGFVNLNGSGNLLGLGGVVTPFQAFDNFDAFVNLQVIPEPASLLVWSCGMGLAFCGRRAFRRRRGAAAA